MKNKLTRIICTTLAFGFLALPSAQAAESEFSLDRLVITALRAEMKDLDTPASVTVRTGEELKATGALTVADALQFIEGINMYSQGPYGQSAGRMSSEIVIRGAKKGTLVMVNGAPVNMNGLFQLDNILLENVEKVEVIRGAGSVMYGSEAFGGVINIITKKQVDNSISSSIGSFGRHSHSLNLQAGKLAFSGSLVEGGETGNVTSTSTKYTNYTGSEKISLNGAYRFTDKLVMNYTHSKDDINKEDISLSTNNRQQYSNDQESVDRFSFQYQDDTLLANVYGAFREIDYYTRNNDGSVPLPTMGGYPRKADVHTNLKTAKYGLDTNKQWEVRNNKYLAGITLETEKYEQNKVIMTKASAPASPVITNQQTGPFERNVIALYTQATHQIDDERKIILGVRGQKTEAEQGKEYTQLLPQLQYNEKIGESSSWFVNIGKAFRLPTLTEMYVTSDRFTGNPNLKPQSGWSYETGWKKQIATGAVKATYFVLDMNDYIETDSTAAKMYQNFDQYRNQGLEVSWEDKLSDKFSYTVGGVVSNPQAYYNRNWSRLYSRVQGTLGLHYTLDKVSANLSANYITDRANDAPPAFPVSLTVNYKAQPETTVFATVRNVLNRHDVTTESTPSSMSGYFYGAPRTIEIGVKHSF
ncbi:TonB-dependent receptor plug domain-containing protein [Dendrosporobacter sp. 1207_IL3150]|uniref:TonB-dependent receptor plug domain-containing protein n=1 Tax=Dendrosporobacter sp. 1207_IL3150 TaxID=3084054 RepID=UPI002FD9D8C4